MRGSDPDAAVYYLAAMLEGGEDPRYIARRMIVLASEDIGNADPRALLVAVAAAQAVEHVGLPEARLDLAQAAIYLARAPKSNRSYLAMKRAAADVHEHGNVRPPQGAARREHTGAASSGTARATSTRTTTRPASRSTTSRRSSRAAATTSPRADGEAAGRADGVTGTDRATGFGPAVVCVHGITSHWLRFRTKLAGGAARPAPSRRGRPAAARRRLRRDAFARRSAITHVDDLLETADALGLERVGRMTGHAKDLRRPSTAG